MKRSSFARRPAPARKELNRDQALALRARAAIESVANTPVREKHLNLAVAHAVISSVATKFATPIPKLSQQRSARLLAMAEGMPCLLRIPGICNRDPFTTVACHSNWREHGGKGGARKADDHYSCWGCSSCHHWLDFGPATKATKQAAFMRAHADQVLMWRAIASDTRRPPGDRKAASWALDLMNSTPNSDLLHEMPEEYAINTGAKAEANSC